MQPQRADRRRRDFPGAARLYLSRGPSQLTEGIHNITVLLYINMLFLAMSCETDRCRGRSQCGQRGCLTTGSCQFTNFTFTSWSGEFLSGYPCDNIIEPVNLSCLTLNGIFSPIALVTFACNCVSPPMLYAIAYPGRYS